ncbi:MAG: 3-deoxy-D-manno-octulosonic acid transferase [Desulfatibacillaceae bacterium]
MRAKTGLRLLVAWALYNVVLSVAAVLAAPVAAVLALFVEKRKRTLGPRLGFTDYDGAAGLSARPVWVHALSVGEVRAAAPLVRELARRGTRPVVVSTSTLTGRQQARSLLGEHAAAVLYYPYDLYPGVARALARVRPAAVVLVESDIWPNFLYACHRRDIPVFLANARLSPESLRGYKRVSLFLLPFLRLFTAVCCQSEEQKERFVELGLSAVHVVPCGNTKFDEVARPAKSPEEVRDELGIPREARVIVAGSTHPGEEEILARVFDTLVPEFPGLCMVVAPRDPNRAGDVRDVFPEGTARTLSNSGPAGARVLVIDRMGVLAATYAAGDVCFVGGSLVPEGGHNPLEPAAAGRPVVFGAEMSDFPEVSTLLLNAGAACVVTDEKGLAEAVRSWLANPAEARTAGLAGQRLVRFNTGASRRVADVVETVVAAWD